MTNEEWEAEIDGFEDDLDSDDEWEFDCHMGPDGLCGAAGSEECDECPYNLH